MMSSPGINWYLLDQSTQLPTTGLRGITPLMHAIKAPMNVVASRVDRAAFLEYAKLYMYNNKLKPSKPLSCSICTNAREGQIRIELERLSSAITFIERYGRRF